MQLSNLIIRGKDLIANPRLSVRLFATGATATILFTTVTILSYFLLPEGLLRNRHPLQNWETSPQLWLSTIQILSFNMLSVAAICLGNLFAARKEPQKHPFPYGLTAFFVMIIIDALVLGTWSFAIVQPSINLGQRFIRMFDLAHRAGLWEIAGQMLIACATTGLVRIITVDRHTTVLPLYTIQLSRTEWLTVLLGLVLMACGAYIESAAILAVV